MTKEELKNGLMFSLATITGLCARGDLKSENVSLLPIFTTAAGMVSYNPELYKAVVGDDTEMFQEQSRSQREFKRFAEPAVDVAIETMIKQFPMLIKETK